MMYKFAKWLLNKFNYELVSFAEMKHYCRAVEERYEIANGALNLTWLVDYYVNGYYAVRTTAGSPVQITIKRFYIRDYGSIEYARACAEELCDKLNEKP